jgi:tripartite ATP-independent transporter DctM subunit
LPVWLVQACMPLGFAILGLKLGWRLAPLGRPALRLLLALAWPAAGFVLAAAFAEVSLPLWPFALLLGAALLSGAPVFAVLGGLALALFWQEGQPLAAVPLSHYQITVNPSLPALPLFTLAGLLFAKSGAAKRLGELFTAAFGGGASGTAIAAACLCSFFTAFTGGSGVTILALGGLLLPLLRNAGLPEKKGIGLVTSASALGVLLLPSVPLIMYAIIARVPINAMFLAGLLPAAAMVLFLLAFGGFLGRAATHGSQPAQAAPRASLRQTLAAAWRAKWEIMAPLVAIGSLVSGLVTPTESAALTAAYAIFSQSVVHRELGCKQLRRSLAECAQTIGGVMLILGMALGLTNFLIDAGIPDAAVTWANGALPGKLAFLVALNLFLLLAGAMMEIFAALVVLVPLLLPVAASYGIEPLHFGVIFLANMEMAFLCPPAGMNIYFASAMFAKPFKEVAASVLRPLLAMFLGALAISWLPELSTWLPGLFIH